MAFKINKTASLSLENPEAMFRDIKTKKIHGPLADQADLWRAYMKNGLNAQDVALQLPTGGGKTLVGLVLAEWRRQKNRERVVFLCPTRQLVNQVVDQAINQYGIKVNCFTGASTEYDKQAVGEYQNCERIAVTTYSSLFNSSPFFDDPHTIILDDAHASESYIASMWTAQIDYWDDYQRPLYEALIAVLKPAISGTDYQRLANPNHFYLERGWVEKLPTPMFHALMPELSGVINAHSQQAGLSYVWPALRGHLDACHLYFTVGRILIRPMLPPTSMHRPFAGAQQRIYMSATFGEAGDLERITGRAGILRL